MRVAIVVPTFPQVSETFIANKAVGLVERGLDLHIVCHSSPKEKWETFGSDHPVHALAGRVHVTPGIGRGLETWRSTAGAAGAVVRAQRSSVCAYLSDGSTPIANRIRDLLVDVALVELEPDVVHFEFGSLATDRMALGRRLGAAVTVSFRGYDLNYVGLEERDYYRPVWDQADGIHVLGADLWRRALKRGASAETPHTVIPPALDTAGVGATDPRAGSLGTREAPLRVLSVGRLHWKKGYDHALEAVAALRRQGLEVEHRIVGDGDLLPAVGYWRRQLGLDDVVKLLRAVPPAEVARQLRWADVFLHAATSEGFCNAVLEAQAHRVPVVCSDADGLGENVADGVTGIVVPRRDPAALATGLAQLAASGELRARMGAAGRDRVERHFRLEDQLDAWERFYLDAVDR